jgi:uncharacterized OB-fold protein
MDEAISPAPGQRHMQFLREGRFMLQRSTASGAFVFYPRVAEPGTGADLEWVEASGRGIVYSTTVIRPRPPQESYNVALIDLAEGPRMLSRVEDVAPEDVHIGMAVQARIAEGESEADGEAQPYVVFAPVA